MVFVRSVFNTLLVALSTFVFSLLAYVARVMDSSGDKVIELAHLWGKTLAFLTGMRVTLRSEATLEPGRPYVFMANHVSSADIWALYAVLPVRVRMIAKKQLGAIPFFGWALRAGRFVFIDRQDPHAARRSIDEAARRIRGGVSVLIFPEGTRSRDGRLGSFKKGGFHLAVNAGVPIVPVAVRGTFALLPPKTLWIRPGPVEVVLAPPVPTQGLADTERSHLVERVQAMVAARLAVSEERPVAARPAAVRQ